VSNNRSNRIRSLRRWSRPRNSNAGAALSGYVGQQAEIDPAGAQFNGDTVHWRYALPSDAAKATITVTDAAGKVLYSKTGETAEGSHEFEWNGELNSGGTAPDDQPYWINVVAEDANGKTMTPLHCAGDNNLGR